MYTVVSWSKPVCVKAVVDDDLVNEECSTEL